MYATELGKGLLNNYIFRYFSKIRFVKTHKLLYWVYL